MGKLLRLFGGKRMLPTDYAGLAVWLDAQDAGTLTFNSGRISQWGDKSGKGNHVANGNASQQPLYVGAAINGKPAIQFRDDGTFKFLSVADNATLDYTNFSCFAVIKRVTDLGATETICGKYAENSPANQREFRIIVSSGDTAQCLGSTGGTTINANAGAPDTLNTTNPVIIDASLASGTLSAQVNNGTAGTASLASIFNGTASFYLGCRDVGAEPFAGHIGEVIFYTSALSAGQRTAILGYLSNKWGVAIS